MDINEKSIGGKQIPDPLENIKKKYIQGLLQHLQNACDKSCQLFEEILSGTKNKTFIVLCTSATSEKSIQIGTFTVEQTLNPIKGKYSSAANLIDFLRKQDNFT